MPKMCQIVVVVVNRLHTSKDKQVVKEMKVHKMEADQWHNMAFRSLWKGAQEGSIAILR